MFHILRVYLTLSLKEDVTTQSTTTTTNSPTSTLTVPVTIMAPTTMASTTRASTTMRPTTLRSTTQVLLKLLENYVIRLISIRRVVRQDHPRLRRRRLQTEQRSHLLAVQRVSVDSPIRKRHYYSSQARKIATWQRSQVVVRVVPSYSCSLSVWPCFTTSRRSGLQKC
jgi:hypothetical protein